MITRSEHPLPLTAEEVALATTRIPPPKRKRPPLTPGRVVYLLYHYPRAVWRDGLIWHYHLWKGRREMAAAIATLPAPAAPSGPPLRVHYLSGHRHLALTLLSALSLQQQAARPVHPVITDDGSIDQDDLVALLRVFPHAKIVDRAAVAENLDRVLPEARFPFLRRLRLGYIHLRKLTDVQSPGAEWRLVLDSDIFFFKHPSQMLALMAKPAPFFMEDMMQSYGAPVTTLETLAGAPVHPKVNVGICHLDAAKIDWEFVEHCARVLLARHGFSYYLEQALVATLMARMRAVPLSSEYLVYPTPEQARVAAHTALHYVDKSHFTMMRYGWRQVMSALASAHTHG